MSPKDAKVRGDNDQLPAPLANPKASADSDQYHHFVPRFILKNFSESKKPKKAQQKGRKKSSATPQELIHCYSVPTRDLTSSLVSKSYGVKNLYKDVKNQQNVHQIEKKLSDLEGHAGRSISELIKTIGNKTDGTGEATFRIKRKYLNYLRKFLFVMHYRKDGYKKIYFQEDHHENLLASEWIRSFRKKKGLEPSEIWLYVLEYYLDTPHSEIIAQGSLAANEMMRAGGFDSLLSRPWDSNFKVIEAMGYFGEAQNFFLVIWEAADGEEFIISDNSFGLTEGMLTSLISPLVFHKFYVVSPRVVLVLCAGIFHPNFPCPPKLKGVVAESMLSGAPHKLARVADNNGTQLFRAGSRDPSVHEEDWMEFGVLKLSVEYTHKVNAIILGNVRDTGTITFHTKPAVLRTLEAFALNRDYNNQGIYEPLVKQLSKEAGEPSSFSVIPNPHPTSITHSSFTSTPGDDYHNWPTAKSPKATPMFGSYQAAYQNYLMFQEIPTPRYIQEKELIIGCATILTELQSPGNLNPRPARLVRTMSNKKAVLLFETMSSYFEMCFGIEEELAYREVLVIAFLDWLLENQREHFNTFEDMLNLQLKEYKDV